jgi:hypothetical protein
MTTWQWNIIMALVKTILQIIEKPSLQYEEFDEDNLNILREAEIRDRNL